MRNCRNVLDHHFNWFCVQNSHGTRWFRSQQSRDTFIRTKIELEMSRRLRLIAIESLTTNNHRGGKRWFHFVSKNKISSVSGFSLARIVKHVNEAVFGSLSMAIQAFLDRHRLENFLPFNVRHRNQRFLRGREKNQYGFVSCKGISLFMSTLRRQSLLLHKLAFI